MTYLSTVQASNPLHLWQCQETAGTTAADTGVSTTLANATYTGGYTLGVVGTSGYLSVELNGTSGYLSVPDVADLNGTGDLTLEILVYPINTSTYHFLMTKLVGNGGATNTYEWRLENTTGIPNFVAAGGTVLATNAPRLNEWSHLAVTISGTTVTHYLNGVVNGSGTLSGTRAASTGTAGRIGSRDDGLSYARIRLSHAAYYNSALTGATITTHYQALSGGDLRVSQAPVEALTQGAGLAVSQLPVEALTQGAGLAVSQLPVEALTQGAGLAVSQLVIETLVVMSAGGGARSQIIITT